MIAAQPVPRVDGRRLRGDRSRQLILAHAVRVASREGLEAVSLQRLAGELLISKSGLFASFGSKQELQLATIEEAARVVVEEVSRPGLRAPRGLPRVLGLCNAFISYLEREVFPGGCPLAALSHEYDSRPGPVRELIAEKRRAWIEGLQRAVRLAQEEGHLAPEIDPSALAWELDCVLLGANARFQLEREPAVFAWARAAIAARLGAAAHPDGSAARALR